MRILKVLIYLALLPVTILAAAPQRAAERVAAQTQNLDVLTYANANSVLGFTTNYGSIFYDASKLFGKNDGFYFPYTSVADILSGVNAKTVVFDAGVWIGGQVDGQTRVSLAEYSSEFVPGPMANGTFQADNATFRVYKLYRDSMASNPNTDYLNWPTAQGAPVDGSGKPQLLGDQTLWTVYNDADPSRHTNNAGRSSPMGVEVQQTVWSMHTGSPAEDNAVYVKYKFYNKGSQTINNFYVSFWADPDVGTASSDLVGCDPTLSEFFAYKGTNQDGVYGFQPPAWGGRVLSGLIVPSPGSQGTFDGHPMNNYRNLPMTAFDKYINGTDPKSAQESYNYMRGLMADGSPYTFNGSPTSFFNSGNPVAGTGDLDVAPADRRLMMSCGPVNFVPGDSQQLVLKFVVAQGFDRFSSVSLLKSYLSGNYTPALCDHAIAVVTDYGRLEGVEFSPKVDQWLTGVRFGASNFNSGAGTGDQFFGSSLDPTNSSDFFPNVEIRFSRTNQQKAFRYLSPGYAYAGYVEVPFTAWDTDHGMQLNVAFVEAQGSRTVDGTWDLDDSAHYGGREYLFILSSPYCGSDSMNSVIKYPTKNLRSDAGDLDILYGGWFSLANGHSMGDLRDGQKLVFQSQTLGQNGTVEVLPFPTIAPGMTATRACDLVCSTGVGFPLFVYQSSVPNLFRAYEDTAGQGLSIPYGIIAVMEVASPIGPVNPPNGQNVWRQANSTGEWQVTNNSGYMDYLNFGYPMGTNDWEIRFTTQGSEAYDQYGNKYPGRVPFEIWNIGDAASGPVPAPRRLVARINDVDLSGGWSWGDRVYAVEAAYQEGGPANISWLMDSVLLGGVIFQDVSHTQSAPAAGSVVRFVTAKNVLAPIGESARLEPDFHSSLAAAGPTNRFDESTRHIKVTFAPQTRGSFNADLLIVDSQTEQVVKAIYLSGATTASCCTNRTGDIDGSGVVDLADLSYLVAYLTQKDPQLHMQCLDAANINAQGIIDLSDLSLFVAYLLGELGPSATLPLCQ